jgi:hypothetical protein
MISVDMSPAAISRRLIRGSQLRQLGVGLAGPRRRPWSKLGPFIEVDEHGEPIRPASTLTEAPPPFRPSDPPK